MSTTRGIQLKSGPSNATVRAAGDTHTLWAGLRRGRVFVTSNADDPTAASVTFFRIDTSSTPTRFVSSIAVDPSNPNHAYISFSGYDAYATAAGTATGHACEVMYNPTSHTATWTNFDENLSDQPITGIALDANTGDLFVSTDFGVDMLRSGGDPVGSGRRQLASGCGLRPDHRFERKGPLRPDPRPRSVGARYFEIGITTTKKSCPNVRVGAFLSLVFGSHHTKSAPMWQPGFLRLRPMRSLKRTVWTSGR